MKVMWRREGKRLALIVIASCIMAANLKSFVQAGGLFPGGFNGLTLLLQQVGQQFLHISLPFSVVNLILNAVPAVVSFRFIGKRFTVYSCLMIILTSTLTDIFPAYAITYDILLICIFGGIIQGLAISLCLFADATSGGTDFISIFVSERYGVNAWNYIFAGNLGMLIIAGLLFGWDKALYSIIFQFACTQVLNGLYKRYQKQTLWIITEMPEEVYEQIRACTNHDATLFKGTGCYKGQERTMLYSVVSSDERKRVIAKIREVDPNAFINAINSTQVSGRFYLRPKD